MQRQPIRPLLLALAVAISPLVFQLPWWAVAWCALSWGYLFAGNRRGWPIPSRGLRTVIFMVGIAVVLLSAGLRLDGSDFITLLAVMAGIKPMEIRSRRDSMATIFLAYFLVITSLFVFENLSMTVYLFVSVWTTTGVLIHVNDPSGTFRQQMRLAARLVLVAVPLMLLLFMLFPRLSGGFWGSSWARQSRSGFSSTMRIGDVSQLVLVDAPAFSVSFDTPLPNARLRYWRGIVFERFDGTVWQPARHQQPRRDGIVGTNLSRYTVVLEPHGHRYLFVLDLPVTGTPTAAIMDDHTLAARRPLLQRFHYDAASFLDYRLHAAEPPDDHYLQLPPNRNPRAAALGNQWTRTHKTPEAVVVAALDFFRDNGFTYTLRPGRLGRDAVDDFLFDSRKGFCEHFASAFAVLMRAAGLPTRIVGGYQGGRWNPVGEFLTVRQSDAHVWCEVWLKGQGWIRVDPTFAVAPDRIDAGIEGALDGLPWFLGRNRDGLLGRWGERLHQTWEAVNTRWNMWFMGFSAEDQIVLLKQVGLSVGRQGRWLLVVTLPLLFIAVVVLLNRWPMQKRRDAPEDEALKIYDRFLGKMARVGMPKAPYRGPRDYSRAVIEQHPALRRDVDEIIGRYMALRYGCESGADDLKALRRQVRRFNPRKVMKAGELRPHG